MYRLLLSTTHPAYNKHDIIDINISAAKEQFSGNTTEAEKIRELHDQKKTMYVWVN